MPPNTRGKKRPRRAIEIANAVRYIDKTPPLRTYFVTARRPFLPLAGLLALALIVPSIAAADSSILDTAELNLSSVGRDLNIEVVLADDLFVITSVTVVLESQASEDTLLDVSPNSNSFSQTLAPRTLFPSTYVVHLTFTYENEDGTAAGAEKIDEEVTIVPESPQSQDNTTSPPVIAPVAPPTVMPDTAMTPTATRPPMVLTVLVGLIAFALGALAVATVGSRRR